MENNRVKSYVLAAGLFVLCMGAGFWVSKVLRGPQTDTGQIVETGQENIDDSQSTVPSPTTSGMSKNGEKTDSKSEQTRDTKEEKDLTKDVNDSKGSLGNEGNKTPVSSVITVTTPKQVNGKYRFSAKCSGASTYHLYSNGGRKYVTESKTGSFANVVANASNYVVVALDSKGKVLCKQTISGMKSTQTDNADASSPKAPQQSYDELTRQIIEGNNYPRNVKFIYTNLEGDEEAQTTVANIRNYIRTHVWTGVTVVNATYDSKGKVTSITLHINR